MRVDADSWSTVAGVRVRMITRATLRTLSITPLERPGSSIAVTAVDTTRSSHWRDDIARRRLELVAEPFRATD